MEQTTIGKAVDAFLDATRRHGLTLDSIRFDEIGLHVIWRDGDYRCSFVTAEKQIARFGITVEDLAEMETRRAKGTFENRAKLAAGATP